MLDFRGYLLIAVSVLVTAIVSSALVQPGAVGGTLDLLILPSYYPSKSTFGIVWTFLYGLMCYAEIEAEDKDDESSVESNTQLKYRFRMQLVLSALWCFCFFTLESPILGGLEILLFLRVVWLWQQSITQRLYNVGNVVLVCYVGWVAFASVINWHIVLLNL